MLPSVIDGPGRLLGGQGGLFGGHGGQRHGDGHGDLEVRGTGNHAESGLIHCAMGAGCGIAVAVTFCLGRK